MTTQSVRKWRPCPGPLEPITLLSAPDHWSHYLLAPVSRPQPPALLDSPCPGLPLDYRPLTSPHLVQVRPRLDWLIFCLRSLIFWLVSFSGKGPEHAGPGVRPPLPPLRCRSRVQAALVTSPGPGPHWATQPLLARCEVCHTCETQIQYAKYDIILSFLTNSNV